MNFRQLLTRPLPTRTWLPVLLLASLALVGAGGPAAPVGPVVARADSDITEGALRVTGTDGTLVECPLKHTDVQAEITGFVSRVTVTQTFTNPFDRSIEAVYVFPLSNTGAVDKMTMVIGDRRIVGVMKKRDEAKRIYEQAIAAGKTASLLDQERPNIFTQTVGNIAPGAEVKIEISYVDALAYDNGSYEFQFPMVVGPRYVPGGSGGTQVPDAARITQPVLKPGFRTGSDISLSVALDAGVPIRGIKSVNHEATITREGKSSAYVKLSPADSVPNRDFVLRYDVAGEKPEVAVMSHSEGADGYFMLMVQPTLSNELAKAPPREVVFLVDVSGSMSGEPTAKVKETMREFLKRLNKNDTFQVIVFYSNAAKLFPSAVQATSANISKALSFNAGYEPGGGTEMMKGILMALDQPADPERVRIVVMLTDGFIGNEDQVIREVRDRSGDQVRFWAIGIGSSPNRYLIDGVAGQGQGMGAVIELNTDPAPKVEEIMNRIHRAQLANVKVDWHGLAVTQTYPSKIPELWAGRPIVMFGRYIGGGARSVTVSGTIEGKSASFDAPVVLATGNNPQNQALAAIWARKKIDDLTSQIGTSDDPKVADQVTAIALNYNVMTQYTSFVAVDESGQTYSPTPPERVDVAVPLPEGVEYEGVFGTVGSGSSPTSPGTPPLMAKQAMVANAAPVGPTPAARYATAATDSAAGAPAAASEGLLLGKVDSLGGAHEVRDEEEDKVAQQLAFSVLLPASAQQVTLSYADGHATALAYDAKSGRWLGKVDAGAAAADGSYSLTLTIAQAGGRKLTYELTYEALSAKPGASVTVTVSSKEVAGGQLAGPWGSPANLSPSSSPSSPSSSGGAWRAQVTVPTTRPAGTAQLTLSLTDATKQQTDIAVDFVTQ